MSLSLISLTFICDLKNSKWALHVTVSLLKGKLTKSDDLGTTYLKNTHGTPFSVKIDRGTYEL